MCDPAHLHNGSGKGGKDEQSPASAAEYIPVDNAFQTISGRQPDNACSYGPCKGSSFSRSRYYLNIHLLIFRGKYLRFLTLPLVGERGLTLSILECTTLNRNPICQSGGQTTHSVIYYHAGCGSSTEPLSKHPTFGR